VHAKCDNLSQDPYKQLTLYLKLITVCTTVALTIVQLVLSIVNDWMCHQSGLPQPDLSVATVTEYLDRLASAHSKIELYLTCLTK